MGKGEYYEVRLGKPLPLADLRSEWFLTNVDQYRPKQGSMALWALGGAGFILKTPTATIYIDPYVGGSVESEGVILHRMIPIPLNASSVRQIDATVITHEGLDHQDENFIFPVNKNTKCQFIGPPSVAELLKSWEIAEERIVSLKENETTIIKDTKIVALPSNDANPKTANTYLFDTGGARIFHSGDSLGLSEFAEVGKRHSVDIAPISLGRNPPGSKWYNDPSEVLEIAGDLNAKILIPMHWDLWYGTLEDPRLVEREGGKKTRRQGSLAQNWGTIRLSLTRSTEVDSHESDSNELKPTVRFRRLLCTIVVLRLSWPSSSNQKTSHTCL